MNAIAALFVETDGVYFNVPGVGFPRASGDSPCNTWPHATTIHKGKMISTNVSLDVLVWLAVWSDAI